MKQTVRCFACAAGRVQGVGFRMFVRQQAVMNDITGWVKNMSDGTVTMELQGESSVVENVFATIREGNCFIHVEHLSIESRDIIHGERDFSIRY